MVVKPTIHGAVTSHNPRTAFVHSSHSANRTIAATARTAMTIPVTHAVQAALVSPAKPKTHGETNRITASGPR